MSEVAMPLATSPALYPPMPSASTYSPISGRASMQSSLWSRTRPGVGEARELQRLRETHPCPPSPFCASSLIRFRFLVDAYDRPQKLGFIIT
jgi:hypothetical protein